MGSPPTAGPFVRLSVRLAIGPASQKGNACIVASNSAVIPTRRATKQFSRPSSHPPSRPREPEPQPRRAVLVQTHHRAAGAGAGTKVGVGARARPRNSYESSKINLQKNIEATTFRELPFQSGQARAAIVPRKRVALSSFFDHIHTYNTKIQYTAVSPILNIVIDNL